MFLKLFSNSKWNVEGFFEEFLEKSSGKFTNCWRNPSKNFWRNPRRNSAAIVGRFIGVISGKFFRELFAWTFNRIIVRISEAILEFQKNLRSNGLIYKRNSEKTSIFVVISGGVFRGISGATLERILVGIFKGMLGQITNIRGSSFGRTREGIVRNSL